MRHAPGWLVVTLLGMLGFLATRGAGAADPPGQPLDAQMLLDLELLKETDLARDRVLLTRMRVFERLRVLEALPTLEPPSRTPPAPKEVK